MKFWWNEVVRWLWIKNEWKKLMDILKMDILIWENFDWVNVMYLVYFIIMIDFESVILGKLEVKKNYV